MHAMAQNEVEEDAKEGERNIEIDPHLRWVTFGFDRLINGHFVNVIHLQEFGSQCMHISMEIKVDLLVPLSCTTLCFRLHVQRILSQSAFWWRRGDFHACKKQRDLT